MSRTITQSALNRLVRQLHDLHDLREALRPFALGAAALPEPTSDEPKLFIAMRAAKELLARLEAEDTQRYVDIAERQMLHERCDWCEQYYDPTDPTNPQAASWGPFCSQTCHDAHDALLPP